MWCSEYNFPRPEIHGGRTLPLSQLVARAPLLLIYTPPLIITLGRYIHCSHPNSVLFWPFCYMHIYYRVSQKKGVLPNQAFGDPVSSTTQFLDALASLDFKL